MMTDLEFQQGLSALRREWGPMLVREGFVIATEDPTAGMLVGSRAPIIAEIINRALKPNRGDPMPAHDPIRAQFNSECG